MAKSRILIIDDEDDIRESMADVLEDRGYVAKAVCNGREALEWLKKNAAPNLIVLDLYMPVMNGYEFREHQLRDGRIATVPLIVISASKTGGGLSGYGDNPAAFLAKPFHPSLLLETVARIIKSNAS